MKEKLMLASRGGFLDDVDAWWELYESGASLMELPWRIEVTSRGPLLSIFFTGLFFYSRHGLRQKEGLLIVYFYSRVNDKTARHTAPPTQIYVYFYFPTSSNVLVKFGLLHRRWKREKIRKSTTLVEKPKSR